MSSPEPARSIEGLVSHLFRRKAGEMVSLLTRVFGVERIELAEDVVQEALLKALQTWPYSGVPDKPGGWIFSVAKNRAMDVLRREQTLRVKLRGNREVAVLPAQQDFGAVFDEPFGDAQLTMVFLCCHPVLSPEAQIALTLKTVGGFGVSEIARAFLVPEQTVAQRLVRAKRVLKKQRLPFAMPTDEELRQRLDAVLQVIYLLFNEGYTVTEGGNLVREDLCGEAIRLCFILAEHPSGDVPKVHALLALMLLQGSRFETRAGHERKPAPHGCAGSFPVEPGPDPAGAFAPPEGRCGERAERISHAGRNRRVSCHGPDIRADRLAKDPFLL